MCRGATRYVKTRRDGAPLPPTRVLHGFGRSAAGARPGGISSEQLRSAQFNHVDNHVDSIKHASILSEQIRSTQFNHVDNHIDSIKHASILSYQLGSTQISSHQFNPAPINSGQLRSAQTKLISIHIISSLSASHPLPTTLSPVSLRFPSTSKHILSILPLSIYIQTHALLSLPAFHPLPIRAARRLTRSVLGSAALLPIAWSCLGRLESCLFVSFRMRKLTLVGRATHNFENHRFPL